VVLGLCGVVLLQSSLVGCEGLMLASVQRPLPGCSPALLVGREGCAASRQFRRFGLIVKVNETVALDCNELQQRASSFDVGSEGTYRPECPPTTGRVSGEGR
jgi:hypothetical protein